MMFLRILVVASLIFGPCIGDARTPRHYSPHTQTQADSQPDDRQLLEHRTYKNKDGETVHSPAHTRDGKAPSGATAQCRDGSYSFSQHHSGTCSRHGGVGAWL